MSTHQVFRNGDFTGIHIVRNGSDSPPSARKAKGVLYEFDEGVRITQEEGTLGVIVIDGLGRGKTASFIMPMVQAMIEDGLGGLIVDVKNNMTPQIMALANQAGRKDDIIELGTHPSAQPINILAGVPLSEVEQMLSAMCLAGLEHTHNAEWIHEGILLSKRYYAPVVQPIPSIMTS